MVKQAWDLKGVTHLANLTFMAELESNLKMWLDWGLLRIGGWFDVVAPSTPGGFGGNFSRLRLVNDPSYTSGKVWEGARKDWVWETGINYIGLDASSHNPIAMDGKVSVNGSDTSYSWVNYPLGRVYFSTAISTTATVLADYSYRWVQIYRATDCEWWKQLQYRSFRVDDTYFLQDDSGSWVIGGQHRIQMPTIILEAVPRATSKPYQLGDGSYWVQQDILCHILAESGSDRNKVVDILRGQFDAAIKLFDSNAISSAQAWPLDYRGMLVVTPKMYPTLVETYPWITCRIIRTEVSEIQAFNTRLYEGIVRMSCEVVLPD